MRTFAFIIALVITISLTWLFNNPLNIKQATIPPLGSLLNPFTGFWQNGESGIPNSQQLDLASLKAPVKVVFDDRLVPHIFAKNEDDAYFAQGYITAQHRLFQMDLVTRSTSGRLAEILGERLLARDQLQRRKGLVFAANNTLNVWKQSKAFSKLEAYVAGVNAYINSLAPKDYPLEFKLLDYQPEAWTPLKTSILLKSMAETLCMREEDLEATNTIAHFGEETYRFLYPEYNPKQSPVIPSDMKWNFDRKEQDSTLLSIINQQIPLPKRQGKLMPEGIGSNNWAVSGKRTATGATILCNDPHLILTLPSVWYEVQLNTPEQNVYGVSLPGAPGVMIGFNNDIAWGMTNVSHDVLDWYRINWAEAEKESYYYNGKLKNVDKVIESYQVKGLGMVYDTVKYTEWGPVVYEAEEHDKQDLAMRWMAHFEPEGSELDVINQLNKATNFREYANALKPYSVPAQNFVFASREGDIAIKVQGRFPIKKEGQGRFVQDGSSSSNDWNGFIPEAQNPLVKNPERGFVSSANQHSTSPDYPYYYNGRFDDYRGRVLNSLLTKLDKATPKDMMDLQNNTFSLKAKEAIALMLPLVNRTDLEQWKQDYLKLLDQWDCRYKAEAKAPLLFEKWFTLFYDMTWDEIYAVKESLAVQMPEDWRTISLLEEEPEHPFFDQQSTPKKETAKDIVNLAFQEMCIAIAEKEDRKESLAWATQQKTQIRHLARIPAFSVTNINIGGSPNALNAINQNGAGPSWRMVVSFEEELKAYGVYPGGQSGNPGSFYYDNMIDSWANGEYYELLFVQTPEELGEHLLYTVDMK